MLVFRVMIWLIRGLILPRATLLAENLALRQQLFVLHRNVKRPRLYSSDRRFWSFLSCFWKDWKSFLLIVQPETVVQWHREDFRLYWKWKSRTGNVGCPKIENEVQNLIRQMSQENPLWGIPRIQAELHLLGHDVAESTVAKYRIKSRKPPSQTWRTFLKNHMKQTFAIDFFTVPTINFRILYCFIILSHDRRSIVHFNVTSHPAALWTAQQIVNAFPEETAPKYLIRDRDSIYGQYFQQRIKNLGIKEVVTAPRSPWQNSYVERVIGTIRRECLDQVIIFSEDHLRKTLSEYFEYYHQSRPHQSLDRNSPIPREIEPAIKGKVISIPMVGGLHHQYRRVA
jgi:transposase InsO family protein